MLTDRELQSLRNMGNEGEGAANEICRLREELAETEELRQRMAALLTGVAVALRGPEPPLTKWSWHDLPERAAAIAGSRPALPPAQENHVNGVQ